MLTSLLYEKIDEGFKASIEELTDYANRINKAIEYIRERTEWNEYNSMFPSILDGSEVKKILNILQGVDKE